LKPCDPNTSSSDSSGSLRMLSAASFGMMLKTGSGIGGSCDITGGCGGAAGVGGATGGAAGGAAGGPAAGAPPAVTGARTTCLQCGQRTCLPSRSIPTPMRRPQNGHGNVCVCDDIGMNSLGQTRRPSWVERVENGLRKVYLTLSFDKHQNAVRVSQNESVERLPTLWSGLTIRPS
jgi:hypothetical protein